MYNEGFLLSTNKKGFKFLRTLQIKVALEFVVCTRYHSKCVFNYSESLNFKHRS